MLYLKIVPCRPNLGFFYSKRVNLAHTEDTQNTTQVYAGAFHQTQVTILAFNSQDDQHCRYYFLKPITWTLCFVRFAERAPELASDLHHKYMYEYMMNN